jgi:acetyl/propionyl-CoA carboxylase alpha subunit
MRTAIDLVATQLRIATGEPLGFQQEDVHPRGHALECRILAEDPFRGFIPCMGRVTALSLPSGPFVRVDTDLAAGLEVTPYYDSLLAKLIVSGQTRDEAILRARRALKEFQIAGVRTTIPFFQRLFEEKSFQKGEVHTGTLEEAPLKDVSNPLSAALIAIAMELHARDRNPLREVPLSRWRTAPEAES